MSIAFRSKSALSVEKKNITFQRVEVRTQYVVTLGNPLLHKIDSVKFIDVSGNDNSVVYQALAVVICSNIYDGEVNNLVCFTREYGVPLIWLGIARPPDSKLFNFSLVTDDANLVWRFLCQVK